MSLSRAGSPVTRAVKQATSTIPIVMALDPDAVGNGFVASLARPGGNITGLSALSPQLSGKQLELLKEIDPKLSRVAVLGSSTRPGNAQLLKEAELAAGTMSIRLQYLDVLNSKDIDTAFRLAHNEHAQAILVLTGPQLNSRRRQIADLAAKNRLPAIYERPEFMTKVVSSFMARASSTCRAAPLHMSIKFSRVPNRLIYRSNNRRSSSC